MKTNTKNNGLISGFISSVNKFPDRPALFVDDTIYTYKELAQKSLKFTQYLLKNNPSTEYVALLGYRSITAYSGIIGILASGKGYVPLNPQFPIDRLCKQINISNCLQSRSI